MTNIWPIGGGKGGTGKSFLTANLGILLSRQGCRTLMIDADLGAANLHTMIGLPYQDKSLSDYIHRRVSILEETVSSTTYPNLFLISGAKNNLDMSNLAYEQKLKFLRAISTLDYDAILVDLGAGTSFNTIDFFMVSDFGIFVTTPEPTSIENTYRLIRAVYARRIRKILKEHHFRTVVEEAENQNREAMVNRPEYLLRVIKEMEPEKGQAIEKALHGLQFKLVLNQLRQDDDPNTGSLICLIISRHLGLSMEFLGNISFDDRVHDAVRRKIAFIDQYPNTQTAMDFNNFSKNFLKIQAVARSEPNNGNGEETTRMAPLYG